MKFATGLAVLLALVLPGSAGAVTIESPNPVYQRWANSSRVQTVPGTVQVIDQPCPYLLGVDGCFSDETVWMNPNVTGPGMREVFLHELGHAYAVWIGRSISDEAFARHYAICATQRRAPRRLQRFCHSLRNPSAISISVTRG